MKGRLSICLGAFSVMALSNVIIPILPLYATGSTLQGAIYSAYFLGAFLITVPAGILSDWYGRVPVMRSGLFLTILSGILLIPVTTPLIVFGVRLLEGISAGLFIAAAMAHVNSQNDHEHMSGYFMAALNFGLMLGLVTGGFLAIHLSVQSGGVILFTLLTFIPGIMSVFLVEGTLLRQYYSPTLLINLIWDYRWIWYSATVLIGITGVITSLYPEYSHMSPDILGIWIAGMSAATITSVLFISRIAIQPVPAIRIAGVFMAGGVLASFFSPAGFIIVGAVAGVVMIAQMDFLAQVRKNQGAVMGLFSTTSYLGMSTLPFIAGLIADTTTFFLAFCATALISLTVSCTIGKNV
jgi:MFS family permease